MARLILACSLVAALSISVLTQEPTLSERVLAARNTPDKTVVVGMIGDPLPLSIDETTHGADLVVDAVLSFIGCRRDDSDRAVLTDYHIKPARVFVGNAPEVPKTPGVASPFILTVYGGEVTVDGVTVRAINHNMIPLVDGGHYLLFLKKGRGPGRFQIYNTAAFEIQGNALRAAAIGPIPSYERFASKPVEESVAEIARAAQSRRQ